LKGRPELADPFQVDHRRTVDSKEARRVKRLLKVGQRIAADVIPLAKVNTDVVAGRLQPIQGIGILFWRRWDQTVFKEANRGRREPERWKNLEKERRKRGGSGMR
jgi:hypothetical protein